MSHRVRRWAAMSAIVGLTACAHWVIGPDPGTDPARIFDTVWADFDAHYSFFQLKGIDWDSLATIYRPKAVRATNDVELFDALAGMLAELHDVHVALDAGAQSYHWEPPYTIEFDSSLVFVRYVQDAQRTASGRIRFGRCADDTGIGYIAISSFTGDGWAHEIDDALAALAGIRALIIDVRGNGGGDTRNAHEIAARFADHERTFAYVRYRNGPHHSDFTDDIVQTIGPGGAQRFTGPVAVLTNRQVYSAAEEFVLAMHVLPNVTTIGDTTGGGSGNPIARELPNGWTYELSQWVEFTPDGKIFEEVGLAPDVAVPIFSQDAERGIDRALRVAVRRLASGA